jgi:hypothetical protein
MENPIEKEVERRKITMKRWTSPWKTIYVNDCHLVCNLCIVYGFNLVIEGNHNAIESESYSLYGHENEYLHPPMNLTANSDNAPLPMLPTLVVEVAQRGLPISFPNGRLYESQELMATSSTIERIVDEHTPRPVVSVVDLGRIFGGFDLGSREGPIVSARMMEDVDIGEERAKEKFKQPDEKEKSKFGTDVSAINGMTTEAAKNKDKTCRFCLESEPTVVLAGCGHMCLCPNCANLMAKEAGVEKVKCPVCKVPSPSIIRLYS